MQEQKDARETAFLALQAWEKSGAWSDQYLSEAIRRNRLEQRDAALSLRLTAGVLQNLYLCDFYLNAFSSVPTEKDGAQRADAASPRGLSDRIFG